MGEGEVASHPCILTSRGLGSCVVAALYDTRRRIGGMAHIMTPKYLGSSNNGGYAYADTAIKKLLREMRCKGAKLPDIVAKVAGGAKMFSYDDGGESIGEQIVAGVRAHLREKGIQVTGVDTGGSRGRSVVFHLDTGKVVVKTLEKGAKVI